MKSQNEQVEWKFGIHQVFYDVAGQVVNYTEKSLVPVCGEAEDLKAEMLIMMRVFEEKTLFTIK